MAKLDYIQSMGFTAVSFFGGFFIAGVCGMEVGWSGCAEEDWEGDVKIGKSSGIMLIQS